MQYVAEVNGWTRFVSMPDQYSLKQREEEREMFGFRRSVSSWDVASSAVGIQPVESGLDASILTKATTGIVRFARCWCSVKNGYFSWIEAHSPS
jgi:hypothetical protein